MTGPKELRSPNVKKTAISQTLSYFSQNTTNSCGENSNLSESPIFPRDFLHVFTTFYYSVNTVYYFPIFVYCFFSEIHKTSPRRTVSYGFLGFPGPGGERLEKVRGGRLEKVGESVTKLEEVRGPVLENCREFEVSGQWTVRRPRPRSEQTFRVQWTFA